MSGPAQPSLSVVLLARDQAWNVDRLIASVRAETDAEVVLVDASSLDGTPERATRHAVGVLRIAAVDGARLTPAAGRYVGLRHTTGDLVLFLDGDMELVPGWLAPALTTVGADPSVAVVTGTVVDLPPDAQRGPDRPVAGAPAAVEVAHAGGAALYRRDALVAAGGFDPWLHGEEEPDVCRRIRRRGGRIVELDVPMALHRTVSEATLASLLARRRRSLYLGSGQIARRRGGLALPGLLRDRPFIATSVAIAALTAAAAAHAAVTRRPTAPAVAASVVGGLAARDAVRGGPRAAAHGLLRRAVVAEGFIRGLAAQGGPPDAYPVVVETLRPATRAHPRRARP